MNTETIKTFITNNWATILTILVILFFIIKSMFNKRRAKPVAEQKRELEHLYQEEFFMPEASMIGSLKEQVKAADYELKNIQKEAKHLVKDEQELDKYYRQQKGMFSIKLKNVLLRYKTWSNHSKNLTEMIMNQEEMEKDLKGGVR